MPESFLTTVIINFQTPDLTRRTVTTFRARYPATPLLLIDNGSQDGSREELEHLAKDEAPAISLLSNPENLHHGPAMDLALHRLDSSFVLFLDSDCVINRGGFIEPMVEMLQKDRRNYAVGKKIFMNRRGYDMPEEQGGHPYIRPICMLVNRELYLTLPPFQRHGAPCLVNMRAAVSRGLVLLHFPVEEYITHEGRGTAGRYGYRLGMRGRLNHLLNQLGL